MYLPKPPSEVQKYSYLDQSKALFYGWGLFSFVSLYYGMILFASSHVLAWGYWAYAIVVGVYLLISYGVGIFSRTHQLNKPMSSMFYRWFNNIEPTVDVYLPCCGESLEVLENTYRYVRALKWPEGKLHVYVLDDSGRAAVRVLADKYEFEYISRPNRGELKKAGNIRYAFPRTHGEFILILDADFCPRPDMIREMVPFFHERVAIVQSPQYFEVAEGQTWIEKGAGYVQELFYRMVQTSRDSFGAPVCVGTCAMYRREALRIHGGTYPIAYSEDLHTGWQALVDGWKVRYIPLNLSMGACPSTLSSYWIQQTRWCLGSTSLLTNKKFWQNKLPWMQRFAFMTGMLYYIATAMSVIFTPLPAIFVAWFFPEHAFWYNYLFTVPSFLFGVVVMSIWGTHKWGWYVLCARQTAYYAHLFAIWEKLKGNIIPWVPTGDAAQVKGSVLYQKYKTFAFSWVTLTSGLVLAGAFYRMESLMDYDFYPMLFFAGLNYWITMKCFKEEA